MRKRERLSAADLRSAILSFLDALHAHEKAINRLNVFPVPDADTGTNMVLTVEAVASAMKEGADMRASCRAMAQASLMGARGISGVILSQVLRSLAERFERASWIDGRAMADALTAGSEAADAAVLVPVEGTILTVLREAARAAGGAADQDRSLVEVLEAAEVAAGDALVRTPDLLPVLKEAGVVDAGAAGFGLLLEAMLHVAAARPMPEAPPGPPEPDLPPGTGIGAGGPRYELACLLEAPDQAIPSLKERWAAMGDSVVVVGGGGVWTCHIHTDHPEAALAVARELGAPREERVTDLEAQVKEGRNRRAVQEEEEPAATEPVPTAVVSVGAGEGIRRMFRSLGAQRVVTGGPTMNPSVGELLAAVESAPAEGVVILPNHEKVIVAAEQVRGLTAKTVRVVPTRAVAEGLSALRAYDPGAAADENAERMGRAASGVRWGEVTQAIRDAPWAGGTIRAGDWIGITREGIRAVRPTLAEVALELLDGICHGKELVTILEGDGSSPGVTRSIVEGLAARHPGVRVEVHEGGQPLHPYLFGVE